MRRIFVLLAVSTGLLSGTCALHAQSAPAYPQNDAQTAAPAGSAPADADQPAPVSVPDDARDALERTIARQGVLIDNQKALIAALKSRLAAVKRKCP